MGAKNSSSSTAPAYRERLKLFLARVGEPLEPIKLFERLARRQGVGFDLGEGVAKLVALRLGFNRRGEQRQIVEPRRNSAGRVAPRLELGEHRFGSRHHRRRKPGELGDG